MELEMNETETMKDELVFRGKISKMGRHKIISIPLVLHDMVREMELEQDYVTVIIKKRNEI